jgi:hypothetical protein
MYKIFTLAAAVSLLPLSQKKSTVDFWVNKNLNASAHLFPYKNTITTNPFEPVKKPAEAWSQNWATTAQENIRKSEYHFTWEEKLNAYCTPNRKNNLRFFYTDKGFSVEPRTTKMLIGEFDPMERPDEIKYRYLPNWKVNFNLDKKQVGKGMWKVAEYKAEYITDKVTVQYINNDEGMRQNFIVHKPLSKTNELKINFGIKTKLKTVLKDNCIQFLHKKNIVLIYQDLKVWDAAGKSLTASFQKNKNKYFINVDTKNTVYPITIDPLSTTPSAILESNQAGAAMGFSVASAGDVNGDGYSDVIAGVPGYDNPEINEGAAFIYHGSATGINTVAATMVESNQANANLGTSVSGAGDVNGDGYADIIVGANLYDNGSTDEGAAFVYHGSATGINTVAATMVESNQALSQMGFSVAGAGDVNTDGYSDVIVGAWLYSNGEGTEGRAFIYQGSATGINSTATTTVESNQVNANLGISVAAAGDVNGDGFSDVIAGAQLFDNGTTDEGAAFIYHGSAAGIVSVAVTMVESNQGFSQFGFSVASAGDVNGDGYSDVIVGAYTFDNVETNEGAAFIYQGSPAGINNTAAAMVESNQPGANLGTSVACAGDINGDGYSDVITGAVLYDNVETNEGAAYVYIGSATGLNITAVAILESNQANAQMGRAVASAGDVNGDGYSDVIVGAYQYDNVENNEGGAFVYHGSAAGLSLIPNNTPDDADQSNAAFGYSVASAGDVNGDGYSDVIIGAIAYDDGANTDEGGAFVYYGSAIGLSATPNNIFADANQSNSWFGWSVASAGDVNSDGYSDVIISAPQYNDGANTHEGRAYVYHGSAGGLSTTPNNTPGDANQAAAFFGWSVASAGDVNGDGYSDVIIGAPAYDDGASFDEGRAFVYHGSATGLSAIPNNTPDDADNATANLGYVVANAGDINGDGYSDVVIGAPNYDEGGNTNEGRAFLYLGSASGLSAIPTSTPDNADQAFAYFGCSVSSAGDVNGDGYSDVVIGAYGYNDSGNSEEGRAFIYHGSVTGLSATPNNIFGDANQSDAWFGWSVASAGDVNGDGYSDVIIGASNYDDGANTNEGRAFIYQGSSSGLSATSNNTPDDADQAFVRFGASVASAGDVNGDGYSDIIIGAAYFNDGINNVEGRSFLYNGNELTTNKRNNLRLYNTDLTTSINSSNFLFSNFGAGLYAKSFLGKQKGKMVWETRINYNAYSGTPITNSTFFTAQQSVYTDMGIAGVELKNLINKINGGRYTKLRARIKYDPVTAITGQIYSPWRNVSSIIDANNLGILPIELISFNATWQQKGKTARLDFKTDKESGICCFDIEKSSDGFNFYSIGTLPAKNVSGIQSYSFIDANATSKNQFYRIKIKGIAGQVDYSNMQHLQNDKATEILVFPNPTTDILQLQLNKAYDKMNVLVINSIGQVVKQLTVSASNKTITIPVQNLAAGKYWLHLQSAGEKQVLQFVKE